MSWEDILKRFEIKGETYQEIVEEVIGNEEMTGWVVSTLFRLFNEAEAHNDTIDPEDIQAVEKLRNEISANRELYPNFTNRNQKRLNVLINMMKGHDRKMRRWLNE